MNPTNPRSARPPGLRAARGKSRASKRPYGVTDEKE